MKFLCKTAFNHLRNLTTIRRFLSHKHCEILIYAIVTSGIDYCYSLLSGLPQYLLQKFQHVQNAASRLLTYSKKYDNISPILKVLHWLTVKSRIEFKMLILTFRAYHEIGPKNLTDSLIKYTPSRTLPSTNKGLLVVPKYNLESYGKRAFSVIAPHSGTIYTRPNKNYSMLEFFLRIELRPFYSAVPFGLFFFLFL